MTDLPKPDNARDAERLRQAMVWGVMRYPDGTTRWHHAAEYPTAVATALNLLPDPVTPTTPELAMPWAVVLPGGYVLTHHQTREAASARQVASYPDRQIYRLAVVEVVEPAKPEPRVVEGPSGYHYRVVHGTAEFRAPAGGDRWFPVGPICLEDACDPDVQALLREVSK